jgi:ferrochelatase
MSNTALLLVNLGSPSSTKVKDVRRYLSEFLMDEKVIDIPYLLRYFLVRGIISPLRAFKSAAAYQSIWSSEGSPLIVISKRLQQELQNILDIPVELAMRYGDPTPKECFDRLKTSYPLLKDVVVMPLYPHYAMSSYETAAEYIKEIHTKYNYGFTLKFVPPFYNHPAYVQTLADSIQPFLEQPFDKILFSYHGIPERHIRKSDITGSHCLSTGNCCNEHSPAHEFCYRHQCFETTRLVTERLKLPQDKVALSFQSRLGRDPWLRPYTAERLAALPAEGIKKILVVCPAFVSDCLETLEEIAVEGKEIFIHAGGEAFTMIPCLNAEAAWIETVIHLAGVEQKRKSTLV